MSKKIEIQGEFDGLATFCNTTPSKPLTWADLEEVIGLVENAREAQDQRRDHVIINHQRWANMIICETDRDSQRFKDILLHMRCGTPFDDYSKSIGFGLFNNWPKPPRFKNLRRQLYKISMRLTDGKRVR